MVFRGNVFIPSVLMQTKKRAPETRCALLVSILGRGAARRTCLWSVMAAFHQVGRDIFGGAGAERLSLGLLSVKFVESLGGYANAVVARCFALGF